MREIGRLQDRFPMDYVDPNAGWTGVMEVRALNRSDIANVRMAYDIWRGTGAYPDDLPAKLLAIDQELADCDGET